MKALKSMALGLALVSVLAGLSACAKRPCGAWQLARSCAFRGRDAGPIVRSPVSVSGPSTVLGPDGSPSARRHIDALALLRCPRLHATPMLLWLQSKSLSCTERRANARSRAGREHGRAARSYGSVLWFMVVSQYPGDAVSHHPGTVRDAGAM
jgi:hypothetical protein